MRARTDSAAVGAGLIVLSAVCFGTLGPLSRFADDAGVSALSLVAWRDLIGATCVIAFSAALGRRVFSMAGLPRRQRWMLVVAAISNTALNLAIFVAFLRISIALALLLFYLYPAYVALAGVLWFGERLDRVRWAALAVSLAGVVLVVGGGTSLGSVDLLGVGLAAFSGVVQAIYVLMARHAFNAVPGTQAAAVTMAGATLLLIALALVSGQAFVLAEPFDGFASFWPVLVAGTIGAGLPTMTFIVGIRLLGASRGAILATLEPVVGVALAAVLLGEQPMPVQLAGGALIIAAGILLQLPSGGAADHEALAER